MLTEKSALCQHWESSLQFIYSIADIWPLIPLPLFVNVVYGCLPVYCVPAQNDTIDIQLWRQMVDPRQCPGTRPNRISECNRIPCPAKWVSSGNYSLSILYVVE